MAARITRTLVDPDFLSWLTDREAQNLDRSDSTVGLWDHLLHNLRIDSSGTTEVVNLRGFRLA